MMSFRIYRLPSGQTILKASSPFPRYAQHLLLASTHLLPRRSTAEVVRRPTLPHYGLATLGCAKEDPVREVGFREVREASREENEERMGMQPVWVGCAPL